MSHKLAPIDWQKQSNYSYITALSQVFPPPMPPAVQFSIWTRQLKAYPRRLIFYLGQETLYGKSLEINHGNIDTIYPH